MTRRPPPVVIDADRGLTLAIQPIEDAPVTSAYLWFDVGSVDEGPGEEGAAHFVEHLLFKGTAERGVGVVAAEIEGLGGDLNAWTSFDETCLHATVVANGLPDALAVLFDMARGSLFDPAELERERQVVLEELKDALDDPDSICLDRLWARTFAAHPYGRPVIGTAASVGAMSRDAILAFFHRHYTPDRAILGIAGPVDPAAVAEAVEGLCRGWEPGQHRATIPTPSAVAHSREVLRQDFATSLVHLAWPAPPAGHPDGPALDVLAHGLGAGAASRLAVRLELDAGIAIAPWAQNTSLIGGGVFSAGFVPLDTGPAVGLALDEISRVVRDGLSVDEIQRAITGIEADLTFGMETTDGTAEHLVWSMSRHRDPESQTRYRDSIRAVGPQAVRRVADRWLDPCTRQLVVLDPDLPPAALDPVVDRIAPAPLLARHRLADRGRAEVHRLGGLRVAILPEASDVVGIRIVGIGGQLVETARTAGQSEAWARAVVRGAGPRDAVAFAEATDRLALSIDATAGRSTQGLQATFPAAHAAGSMAAIADVLLAPRFDPDDWEKIRDDVLSDMDRQQDDAESVATEALWRGLWPKHPWRLPTLGTPASIRDTTPRHLAALHDRILAADNLVVAVVGGVDPDEILRTLSSWAEALPRAAVLPTPPPPGPPATHRKVRRTQTTRATVIFGARGVGLGDPDGTALTLARHLLDSQSGRLFLELREQTSLAYALWSELTPGIGGGTFSVGMSTDPARATAATRQLKATLMRLVHDGPEADELARVKRMVTGLAAMRQQRVGGRAAHLATAVRFDLAYGLDPLAERVAAVDAGAIRDALGRLDLDRGLEVIVRPSPR